MLNTLKGWLVDNTITTDNKEDKILMLESAGNVDINKVIDEMIAQDTGLRRDTLVHAVNLYNRTVANLVLNGYNVNTGLFRAVPQFQGVIERGQWNPEKNSVYVTFIQDKQIREAIAQTEVKILGTKADVMYILEVEDKKTGLKDGSATPGRNFFVRGAYLKVVGSDPACGVTLTNSTGTITRLDDDLIAVNKPSELLLLLPSNLENGSYTLTITTQYANGATLKTPRSVSTVITIGSGGEDDRPDII